MADKACASARRTLSSTKALAAGMTTAELFYRFGFPKNYRADRSAAWVVQKVTRALSEKLDLNHVEELCFFPEEMTTERLQATTEHGAQLRGRTAGDVIQSNVPADNDVKYPMLPPLYSTMGLLCSRTADARLTPSRGVA
jgi:hypothetical protein